MFSDYFMYIVFIVKVFIYYKDYKARKTYGLRYSRMDQVKFVEDGL